MRPDASTRAIEPPPASDRMHGHHRHVDGHGVFDLDLVGDGGLAAPDQRDVGRGPSHVVGDEVRITGAAARESGRNHPGSGSRHHRLGRFGGDEAGRDHAAIAIHDQEVAGIAQLREFASQALDIALEDRLDGGVDSGGDAALELARLRQQRVAHGDVAVRPALRGDFGGAPLMQRIGIGMKEMDHQGFAAGGKQRRNCFTHRVLVERRAYPAARLDAFGDFEAEVAGDDGSKHAGHPVSLRPRPAAELYDVAKAARGDHAGAGEPPLEDRIGGGGGAVHDEADAGSRNACPGKRRHHAERLILGRRRRLGDMHPATGGAVDQDQVGECAADVDPGHRLSGICANLLDHRPNPKCRTSSGGPGWKAFSRPRLDPAIVCILIILRHKASHSRRPVLAPPSRFFGPADASRPSREVDRCRTPRH